MTIDQVRSGAIMLGVKLTPDECEKVLRYVMHEDQSVRPMTALRMALEAIHEHCPVRLP